MRMPHRDALASIVWSFADPAALFAALYASEAVFSTDASDGDKKPQVRSVRVAQNDATSRRTGIHGVILGGSRRALRLVGQIVDCVPSREARRATGGRHIKLRRREQTAGNAQVCLKRSPDDPAAAAAVCAAPNTASFTYCAVSSATSLARPRMVPAQEDHDR